MYNRGISTGLRQRHFSSADLDDSLTRPKFEDDSTEHTPYDGGHNAFN